MNRKVAAAIFAFAVVLCHNPRIARAADPPPFAWSSDWPTFRPAEIAFTGGLALQSAAGAFLFNAPTRNWEGGILFDDALRDGLRLRTRGGRNAAATTSDMMYYALLAYPVMDAPITAGVRGDSKIAVQTLAINLESYAFSGAFALAGEKLGRARPAALECDRDQGYDRRCGEEGRNNSSFLSGHTALAFTGASLTCVHHVHIPLYGGGVPDAVACSAAVTIATASGVLRVLSDNHYATDIILGASLGVVSGYLMPRLLHYRDSTLPAKKTSFLPTYHGRESGIDIVVHPTISPLMSGAMISGTL